MGVYIKNMEKPKGCRWCPLNHDSMCYVIQPYKTDETNGEQCRNNCPLIDLVTCGECKWWKNETCEQWSDPNEFNIIETDPDDFCSYGERRADVSESDMR